MMNKDERNEKMKKAVKKGASISLCAVLAGGLAAGAFQGVNTLTGWNQPTQVEAAVQRDDGVTLLKTKTESKDSEEESGSSVKGGLDVSDIVEEAMPSVIHYNKIPAGSTELFRIIPVWKRAWICSAVSGSARKRLRYYYWKE
ncbi:MAG: hypothetical protein Q4C77_12540 [Eubacteriales bacterium]|nr:hypothetical protein [Eubacteriales bacterium]